MSLDLELQFKMDRYSSALSDKILTLFLLAIAWDHADSNAHINYAESLTKIEMLTSKYNN